MNGRPNTPPTTTATGGRRITVKRHCDRCGREVGDATADELDAATAGAPLPDVTEECGCRAAAAAVLVIADHAESGVEYIADLSHTRARFRCPCGADFEAEPGAMALGLQVHQVDVVRDAIREARG